MYFKIKKLLNSIINYFAKIKVLKRNSQVSTIKKINSEIIKKTITKNIS